MNLQQLLPERRFAQPADGSINITALTMDSRAVQPGSAFLACRGIAGNGADYIEQAVANGAEAVLVAADQQISNQTVPVIAVEDLEQRLGELADRFYQSPSAAMHVVGITGTNGKTSTSHFLAKMLNFLESPSAVMGTVGYGFLRQLKVASHTTPDVIRVHQMMSELREQGAQNLLMEVSSHALDQGRVDKVNFAQAVFTNLTRDHLDYHGNMQSYGAAKAKLFTHFNIRRAVINLDDAFAATLLEQIPSEVAVCGYGMAPSELVARMGESMICMERYHLTTQGIWGEMSTPNGPLEFRTPVIGRFNLSNLMAAVGVLQGMGYSNEQIRNALEALTGVDGRMETVADNNGRLVVIDYAHTPDALEKVLLTLREHTQGKLWCVFGCGGDRDTGKRSLMGEIAARHADFSIVTSDNPRSEDPASITQQIVTGMHKSSQFEVCLDRSQAIDLALARAMPGDAVLVAGKGHEDYQEVAGVRYPFSDRQVITAALEGAA